jgi:prepilin-type N-terminal cleavage/methylation domain
MKEIKAKKGFTIIEVVLVLAIAGLIFLMVFIALPALQRGQRDTQRRDDVARLFSQINSYQTNNRGDVPQSIVATVADGNSGAVTDVFLKDYMKINDTEFNDPQSGDSYGVKTINTSATAPATSGTQTSYSTAPNAAETDMIIYSGRGYQCDTEGNFVSNGKARSVAAAVKLEGSGYYCQDNQ